MSRILTRTGLAAGLRRGALSAALLLAATVPTLAGEINEEGGVAIKGYDPVAYFTQGKPVEGLQRFTAAYKGATFRFASAENRAKFAADPARYAPQYGGFCAYGTSRGYKAAIDPTAFTVIGNRLYLNYSQKVRTTWSQDTSGYIAKANQNWPTVVTTENVAR